MVDSQARWAQHTTYTPVRDRTRSSPLDRVREPLLRMRTRGSRTLMALLMLVAQASSLDVTTPPGVRARVVLSAVEKALPQDHHGPKSASCQLG